MSDDRDAALDEVTDRIVTQDGKLLDELAATAYRIAADCDDILDAIVSVYCELQSDTIMALTGNPETMRAAQANNQRWIDRDASC